MYITSPDPIKRIIEEYDFNFINGMMLPISIDKDSGDTIDYGTHPTAILISIAKKPSQVNPDLFIPAEEITIFLSHLLSIQKRVREVEDSTPEQKDLWKQTVQEISRTVQ